MASLFTGLAFMHGHIVDRELVLRLGREDATPRAASPATRPRAARPAPRDAAAAEAATRPACATC